jgi:hypothetical protein
VDAQDDHIPESTMPLLPELARFSPATRGKNDGWFAIDFDRKNAEPKGVHALYNAASGRKARRRADF